MSDQTNEQGYDERRSGIFNPNEYVAHLKSKEMFEHVTEGCQCEGKRCTKCEHVKCHGAFPHDRRVKSGLMAQCKECKNAYNKVQYEVQAEKRREQQKVYYYAHHEQYKTYKRTYYQLNCERIKTRSLYHYHQHAERYRIYSRVYRQDHLEQVRARDKTRSLSKERRDWSRTWRRLHIHRLRAYQREQYYQHAEQRREKKRDYYRTHRAQIKEYHRAYHRARPGLRALHARNRRARERQTIGNITSRQWEALKAKYAYRCLCCQRKEPEIKLTIDHVVPICKGGTNSIENIQPLCFSCNASKREKIIDYRKDVNP